MPAGTTTSTSAHERAAVRSGVLIEARDLCKTYAAGTSEITVLSGVNVRVEAGELIAVVGASGAGKSTLLHLLAALDTPTSGTVYFEQKAIESFREKRACGLSQSLDWFCLAAAPPVGGFYGGGKCGYASVDARRRASVRRSKPSARWLGEVGLDSASRTACGRACPEESNSAWRSRARLCNNRPLLLADEPTGDLDERNASRDL